MRIPRKLKKKIKTADLRTAFLIVMRLHVKYCLKWKSKFKPIPFKNGGTVYKMEPGEPVLTREQVRDIFKKDVFKS